MVCQNGKVHYSAGSLFFFFFFFCWQSQGLVVFRRFGDSFVSQNPREVCASHFLRRNISLLVSFCPHPPSVIWCFSMESKSDESFSRMLLNILTDLNNVGVCIAAILPYINNSSMSLFQCFRKCSKLSKYICLQISHLFLALRQDPTICQSFCFCFCFF